MRTILIAGDGRGLGRATAEKLPPPATACRRFVPATATASANGVKRRLMQVVLPHMPFATPLDAAVDALALMAVDQSIEAAAGQSFGQGRPIALSHPGARA